MVALTLATCIAVHRFVAGFAVHTRGFIIGIAHAGSGEFGQDRFDRGAGFGVEQAVATAHPVGALLVNRQIAPPRPIGIVGQITVLIEQKRQPVGSGPELCRAPTRSQSVQGRPRPDRGSGRRYGRADQRRTSR